MQGQKAVVIIIVAMFLTVSIGCFANVNETMTTRVTYDKITDLEGIIGENAGHIDSYDEYNPLSNVTGWYGNSEIPTLGVDSDGNPILSPYVINPRNSSYDWGTPIKYSLNSLTRTMGSVDKVGGSHANFTTNWETNKEGVTYSSYPIEGDSSSSSRDAWIKYSDGSYIHGGMSTTRSIYDWGVAPIAVYTQNNTISYYMAGVKQTYCVFLTLDDLLVATDIAKINQMLISVNCNVIYNADLNAEKVAYHPNDSQTTLNVESSIHIDGITSTASYIKYADGLYYGLNTASEVVWESQHVYLWTTANSITVNVGTPINTTPTYADPYNPVTIYDSEYNIEPHTESVGYDWSGEVLTDGTVESVQFARWEYFVTDYCVDSVTVVPNGYGNAEAHLLNNSVVQNETLNWPEQYPNSYSLGVRYIRLYDDLYYGPNPENTIDVRATVGVNFDDTDAEISTGYIAFIRSDDLLNRYFPDAQIGDKITLTTSHPSDWHIKTNQNPYNNNSTVSSILNTTVTWAYSIPNNVPTRVTAYNIYTNQSCAEISFADAYFLKTAEGWILYNANTDTAYPRYTPTSPTDVKPTDYLLYAYNVNGQPVSPYVQLHYYPSTLMYNTNEPGVHLVDLTTTPLEYTDGTIWRGGKEAIHTGSQTWPDLTYWLEISDSSTLDPATEEFTFLRWIDVYQFMISEDISYNYTATKITFLNLNDILTDRTFLTTSVNQTVIDNTTSYSVVLDSYQHRIDCDYLLRTVDSQGDEIWEAYSGSNVVWSGNLSELYIVQAYDGPYSSAPSVWADLNIEGFHWGNNPAEIPGVAYWTNSLYNATIVDGAVSLLLVPLETTESQIKLYTSDELNIFAQYVTANQYMFSYQYRDGPLQTIGQYYGVFVEYSLIDNTVSLTGLLTYTNTVTYTVSPISFTENLVETESINYLYLFAIGSDWGAYITSTKVQNDPLGYLWGGFDVNLNNYLNQYLPGLRVSIGGVVRYGDSLTVNNVYLPVNGTKFVYDSKEYELRGSMIDYSETNHTLLRTGNTTIDLGETHNYSIAGTGLWYFSSGAFKIDEEAVKEYQWVPGWDLSISACIIVFVIACVGCAIVCMRLEWIGLEAMDYVVLVITIIICFTLLGMDSDVI